MKATKFVVLVVALLKYVSDSFAREEAGNMSCPTWLYRSHLGQCVCGSKIQNVILCNNISQEVSIMQSFCLTSDGNDGSDVVVGDCLYSEFKLNKVVDLYFEVDKNISRQDQKFCGYLNREGRLCGKCKRGHYVSAYSYDLKYYKCSRGLLGNIILYLTVAYVPLTVFLAIVVVFHISFSTPRLNLAIYLCQCYTLPNFMRELTHKTRNITKPSMFFKILASLYGIWNLDFFRTLIPPICLPLNTMQVIALDYLVAVYPLLVLVSVYVLVRAHDRGCRLVVQLWRPFLSCFARMRQQFNIRNSVIDAFASFILFSCIKFLNVSSDLLITTEIININGSNVGYYMYYDATIEFLGQEHMPYFILAIAVGLILATFPLILFFYPMQWCQTALNKLEWNCSSLRMLMECFQGYYRDRSDGGWDCRYFSAVYLTLRFLFAILYIFPIKSPLSVLLIIAVVFFLLCVHPYKKKFTFYNKLDTVFLLTLISSLTCASGFFTPSEYSQFFIRFGFVITAIFVLVPFFYLTILFLLKSKFIMTVGYLKRYNTLN